MDNGDCGAAHRAAYLGDHAAVTGCAGLLEQLRAAERVAVARWGSPALRLFVDSGSTDDHRERGPALERLLQEVRAGTVRDVVVSKQSVLASSRAAARRAVGSLVAEGATVHFAGRAGRRRAVAPSRDAGS